MLRVVSRFCGVIMVIVAKIKKEKEKTYRLGAPAATVTHICALQVLDVNLIYNFWVLLLDL